MSAQRAVVIDPRARRAFPDLPELAKAGSYWQLADGQMVRIGAAGDVEQLQRGGVPWGRSVASDPAAARRS